LRGHAQREWVVAVRAELDNFRTAIASSIGRADARAAQAMTGGLAWFWWTEGGVAEGFDRLEAALALVGPVDADTRATALARAAFLALLSGRAESYVQRRDEALVAMQDAEPLTRGACAMLLADLAEGRGAPDEALDLYQRTEKWLAGVHDPWATAMCVFAIGQRLRLKGDLGDARLVLEDAAQRLMSIGDRINAAICLRFLARLTERAGDYDAASEALSAALASATDLGFDGAAVMLTARLGAVAVRRGDFHQADARLTEAVAHTRERCYPILLAMSLNALSELRRRQARLKEAISAASEAFELHRLSEISDGVLLAMRNLGFAAEQAGDAVEAERWHREALAEARRMGDREAVTLAAEGLAGAAALGGEAAYAARLLGAAAKMRASDGRFLWPGERFDLDRIEAMVAGQLERDALEAARAEGAVAGVDAVLGG
jgi:tetratricopeptide (TPR) repeat protein